MATTENKAIVRRLMEEGWNRGNLAVFDEHIAPQRRWHAPNGRDVGSPELHKHFVAAMRAAFPDLLIAIEDQIAEGDTVVTRFAGRGTHQGPFQGIPPTGRQILLAAVMIDRLAAGRIIETWAMIDDLGMLQQLGALPRLAQVG